MTTRRPGRYGTRVPRAAARVLLIFLVSFGATVAGLSAQEVDGDLSGRQLSPAGDLGSIIGSIIGGSGGRRIASVTVVADAADRLEIEIVASADAAGTTVTADVRDRRRRRLRAIAPVRAEVDDTGTARLALAFADGVPEAATFTSRYLRLALPPAGGSPIGVQLLYELGKTWRAKISPENVLVEVTAEPVGAAATLRSEQQRLFNQNLPPVLAPTAGRGGETVTFGNRVTFGDSGVRTLTSSNAPPTDLAFRTPGEADTILRTLPADGGLITIQQFDFGLRRDDRQRGARGPGNQRVSLLEGIRSDVDLPAERILPLLSDVFLDQSPGAGVYYYLPRAFHLAWNEDDGYGMRMLYAAATDGAVGGDVLTASRLASGVTTGEATVARALLEAYQRRNRAVPPVRELRPLPLAAPPALSLSGGLAQQFDITAERIAVHAISDALGAIDVSWITDPVTTENLRVALTADLGISGVVSFAPFGGGLQPVGIPVRIQLAEATTFGQLMWRRQGEWRNRTPYPLRLKHLHALLLHADRPVIYSWSLGDAEVPPAARVAWNDQRVPAWVEARALRMWVDYAVDRDCAACDRTVIADVTAGVSGVAPSTITFRTLTPLADTGAIELAVRVRSRYFHPRDRALEVRPLLVLDQDLASFTTGPVFLIDRQPGEPVEGDPLFEWQLELLMPDGRTHRAESWTASDRLRVNIGSFQVGQQLGVLPGLATADGGSR